MSSEEQRQKEEAASRRHAKLDNAGVLHMSTQAEIPDKITIVSARASRCMLRWRRARDMFLGECTRCDYPNPTDRQANRQLPGHEPDYSACTFCLWEEDHTLGNALRWMIMKE